jgi:hypothetical protein
MHFRSLSFQLIARTVPMQSIHHCIEVIEIGIEIGMEMRRMMHTMRIQTILEIVELKNYY